MGRSVEYGESDPFAVISYNDRAFDFAGEFRAPGREYEVECYRALAAELPENQILLGPKLVNYILEQSLTAPLVRPDMLAFTAVQRHMWSLNTLYECRNKKRLRASSKLDGYAVLLDKLRKQPLYLGSIMSDFDSSNIVMPRLVSIPDNKDLSVVFMGPNITSETFTPNKKFQVGYMRVPSFW